MDKYFGKYERFETASKKDASVLLSADNLIGDIYSIEVEFEDGIQRAWMVSRFGKRVGYFSADVSRKLSVMQAQGMTCKAILSYVAFTDHPDDGIYWGQAAIICYNPAYESDFEPFISNVAAKIGDDVRPRIDLNADKVDKIIETNGTWMPSQTMPSPSKEKGTAIVKRRRSMTDKLVEQGRAGNKGCYILSWIFLLAVVTLIVWGVVSCSA